MEHVERGSRIIAPCVGAAAGFNVVLFAWQGAGKLLGISCATPIAGSIVGGVAVASASVIAAQVAETIDAVLHDRKIQLLSRDQIIFHAAFGALAFQAFGGRFKNVMASNLSYPGALARSSLPAKGVSYATKRESQILREFYSKYGCHHCGSTRGICIADHMPPNVMVRGRVSDNLLSKEAQPFLQRVIIQPSSRLLMRIRNMSTQRFYPQCLECMKKQSAALRHGKSQLVLHFKAGFPEPPYLTGFISGALKQPPQLVSFLSGILKQPVKTVKKGFPESPNLTGLISGALNQPKKTLKGEKSAYSPEFDFLLGAHSRAHYPTELIPVFGWCPWF